MSINKMGMFIVSLAILAVMVIVAFFVGFNMGYAEAIDEVKHDHSLIDGLHNDPDLLNELL